MSRDLERLDRNKRAIAESGLGAVVAALPSDVLLLSGYWPVVGVSAAIATPERALLIVPEDERALAEAGFASEVVTFKPGSLDQPTSAAEQMPGLLRDVVRTFRLARGRIGWHMGSSFEPASYASMHFYGAAFPEVIHRAIPDASLVAADEMITVLRTVLTPGEVQKLRIACRIAERAFELAAEDLEPGIPETEAAGLLRAPLHDYLESDEISRAGGFAWCMSGPNSADAYAAYQRSRPRALQSGDLVLMHGNSYVDGLWTDITRTYCLGAPDERQTAMYAAVLEARAAAIAAVKPGARAAAVDAAAREVMAARGYGSAFKHATGHGVGYSAINHNAPPRLHPKSDDALEPGMVFNIEPAAYLEGYGGMRHCDMVLVTPDAAEVLTPFHESVELLQL